MKITLTLKADELKIVQLLSKFAEKYRASYSLHRQAKGFILKVELNSEDFGEFIRRMNHLKDAAFKIDEIRGGGFLDKFNVTPTRTNVDALVDKETIAKTDIDPIDGGIIKLRGELWLARPDDDTVIKEGAKVRVVRIEGVSLIVEGVNKQNV